MKAKRIHIKRSPTVNACAVGVFVDEDGDVVVATPFGQLAMNRDEARRLAKLLVSVAEG